ncbi:putative brt1 protein [Microdochium bolleyi]|uniref:Putative brt1 protein n=1 Tax=Microdochium bolleyi TaxID=196109 RepID=A0A136IRG0_9PEZI|nr:putative brt1 protein [Microdochium bolleyi]
MAPFTTVTTSKAPEALPQFSQAVKYKDTVYTSGNIGLDPETWKMVDGGVKEQTRQALKNIAAILEEAGSSFDNVYKSNIFITNMDNFAAMNEAWDEVFTGKDKPCRTCVAVFQLPLGALVEIECSAALN